MKYTKEQLLEVVKKYKTYSELLKNRKLYYLLHNRGILKEATMHLTKTKKKHRQKYTKGVVDLAKLLRPMRRFTDYKKFREQFLSHYVILKRHGFNPQEVFENKDDPNYIKKLMQDFGKEQLEEFLEK